MDPTNFSFNFSLLITILAVIAIIRKITMSSAPPSPPIPRKEEPSGGETTREYSGPQSAAPGFTSKYPTGPDIKYKIHVMDNHDSSSYGHKEYEVYEDAVEECKSIVEEFLCNASPDQTVGEIMKLYGHYGEAPWIVPQPEGADFDAWKYAKQRAWSISKVSAPFVKATFTTSKYPTGPDIRYTVHVKFNSGSKTYQHQDYDLYEDAVEECKNIVEDYLCDFTPDLTADFIMRMHETNGKTPWIVPKPKGDDFDALEYLRQRAKSISKVSD